jgi:hypothetical protein
MGVLATVGLDQPDRGYGSKKFEPRTGGTPVTGIASIGGSAADDNLFARYIATVGVAEHAPRPRRRAITLRHEPIPSAGLGYYYLNDEMVRPATVRIVESVHDVARPDTRRWDGCVGGVLVGAG